MTELKRWYITINGKIYRKGLNPHFNATFDDAIIIARDCATGYFGKGTFPNSVRIWSEDRTSYQVSRQ